MDLDGSIALVTGASRGVGRATAVALARAGAKVIVTARTMIPSGRLAGSLAETVDTIEELGGQALALMCDLSDPGAAEHLAVAALEWQGRVDILINNAAFLGKATYHSLDELSLANWQRQLNVNVTAPLLLMKALVPQMRQRRLGAVVNLTSASGNLYEGTLPGFSYGTTKAAINRMTVALARDLRPHGVTVFAVEPGYVRTEIAEQAADASNMDVTTAHPPEVPAGVILDLLVRDPSEVSGCIFGTVAGHPPVLRHDGRQADPDGLRETT